MEKPICMKCAYGEHAFCMGAEWCSCARCHPSKEVLVLRDMLLLLCIEVPTDTITYWSPTQKSEVEEWAGWAILKANDNPVRVPPMPQFLGPYLAHSLAAAFGDSRQ